MAQITDNGQGKLNTDCIICLELADQALVTTCCIDLICKACYEQLIKKKNQCPKCKCQGFKVQQELYIRKFIRQISPYIQFFVKSLTGDQIPIRLRQLDTLDMLFQRVKEYNDIPIQQIRLYFQGKNLKPTKESLKSVKIKASRTVQQLSRMHGGKK